jgi:hypothetical protein
MLSQRGGAATKRKAWPRNHTEVLDEEKDVLLISFRVLPCDSVASTSILHRIWLATKKDPQRKGKILDGVFI